MHSGVLGPRLVLNIQLAYALNTASDAERDITGIEGLLFRNRLNGGEKMVLKI